LQGQRVAPEKLGWAGGALAAGWGLRAVARVFAVDPNTVLAWLVEGAEQAAACSPSFLHDVRGTQGPLEELFALLSAVQPGEVSAAEASQRVSRSPHWVGGALDPVTTLRRTRAVGDRTLARAPRVVHQGVEGLAPGGVPRFLTDGFKEYTPARLTHDGQWGPPARWRAHGPLPQPRGVPLPGLRSAQVVKTGRRRRRVDVQHRLVCGTLGAVQQGLAVHGWQITPACMERVHLTSRQHVAAGGRRVSTLGQHAAG
jgi:hypothetical protein